MADQTPHTEDEIYVVTAGRARFVERGDRVERAGDTIFVAAGVEHRFVDITEDLALVVVFAPAEYSRAGVSAARSAAAAIRCRTSVRGRGAEPRPWGGHVRVLGVDPGLTRCGVGVVDGDPARTCRLVAVEVVRPTRPTTSAPAC